jgi:hypothetical protein
VREAEYLLAEASSILGPRMNKGQGPGALPWGRRNSWYEVNRLYHGLHDLADRLERRAEAGE